MDYNNADIRDMMRAANHIMIQKRLTSSGIGSIIFGSLAIYIGMKIEPGIETTAIIAIGIFLFITGISSLTNPSPAGILADGFGIAAVGLWNIAASMGDKISPVWAIFGLFQLKLAYDRYNEYKLLSRSVYDKPSPETLEIVKSIINDLSSRDIDASDDIIEIKLNNIKWRALLIDRAAVFSAGGGRGVFIVNREDLQLSEHLYDKDDNMVAVSGNITDDNIVLMVKTYYERYLRWKGVPESGATAQDNETENEGV